MPAAIGKLQELVTGAHVTAAVVGQVACVVHVPTVPYTCHAALPTPTSN